MFCFVFLQEEVVEDLEGDPLADEGEIVLRKVGDGNIKRDAIGKLTSKSTTIVSIALLRCVSNDLKRPSRKINVRLFLVFVFVFDVEFEDFETIDSPFAIEKRIEILDSFSLQIDGTESPVVAEMKRNHNLIK